jgi:hypothetical protein
MTTKDQKCDPSTKRSCYQVIYETTTTTANADVGMVSALLLMKIIGEIQSVLQVMPQSLTICNSFRMGTLMMTATNKHA